MTPEPCLGIDIAKDSFSVALLRDTQTHSAEFANSSAGFKQLSQWLGKRKCKTVRACLEATGRYGEPLAEYLYGAGHPVSVVNPMAIKAYAQSRLQRNKNDKLDAGLIARYCQSEQPQPWSPPAPEIKALRELLHQYDSLQAARQQVRNRLGAGLNASLVREQLQAQQQLLEAQLAELKKAISTHIDQFPDLKRNQELLKSIPAIGSLTAAKIQAADTQRFESAQALAAYAGVTPMNRVSGSSVRGRPKFSKLGNATLRRALYMPAVVAIRRNPVAQQLYERLRAKGMAKKAAIGAVMHQLLRLAYGVLKSGLPFDADFTKKTSVPA
jgi:transposase